MTPQEIIDAFIAGGEAKTRAQDFLLSGSDESRRVLNSGEFVRVCLANLSALGVTPEIDAPLDEAEIDALLDEADDLEERAAHLRAKADAMRDV